MLFELLKKKYFEEACKRQDILPFCFKNSWNILKYALFSLWRPIYPGYIFIWVFALRRLFSSKNILNFKPFLRKYFEKVLSYMSDASSSAKVYAILKSMQCVEWITNVYYGFKRYKNSMSSKLIQVF